MHAVLPLLNKTPVFSPRIANVPIKYVGKVALDTPTSSLLLLPLYIFGDTPRTGFLPLGRDFQHCSRGESDQTRLWGQWIRERTATCMEWRMLKLTRSTKGLTCIATSSDGVNLLHSFSVFIC